MKAATIATVNEAVLYTISIHAAREGGDDGSAEAEDEKHISIHAAREGGDCHVRPIRRRSSISIHAAREGGDCGNE